MPRRILLMRHAKSSWAEPSLPDHDRPLNGRGRRAAASIGTYVRERGLVPELVLCSSATRATETLARLALDVDAVRVRDDLYGADADAVLGAIRATPEAVGSVAVIAHDPGMHDLARRLAGDADGEDADAVRERFPTGALAVFEHGGTWSDVDADVVRLVAFVRPRDLA